jgi:hypothetical protein
MLRWINAHRELTAAVTAVLVALGGFVLFYFAPQALLLNTRVNETAPQTMKALTYPTPTSAQATVPVPVARSGDFRSLAHQTSGRASLLLLPDGTYILRLENLDTSNGPDVHIFLSPQSASAEDSAFAQSALDLGTMKANQGNANYAVPAGTDVTRYRSAVIWCQRFSVGFGVAPLQ